MIECMKTAAKLPERNEEKTIEEKENKNRRNIFISADRLPEHRIIWNVLRKQKRN